MKNSNGLKPLDRSVMWDIVERRDLLVRFPLLSVAEPTPLLDEAMCFIERHPDRHDQALWMRAVDVPLEPADDAPICGTAGCLAGWGVAFNNPLEGMQILPGFGVVVLADQTRHVEIKEYAAHLFGITWEQARLLFEPDWKINNLRWGVEAIKDKPSIQADALRCAMAACYGCGDCNPDED